MKPIAGYIGSNEVFKRLITWGILDLPMQIKMKPKIIIHPYMRSAGKKRAVV